MRVSVIIPTFNNMPTVARALESSLSQPIDDLEVIVVDDCSVDATASIVGGFGDRVKLFRRQLNGGPSAARNDGLRKSTGELIAFLDADDYWLECGLDQLCQAMTTEPKVDVIHAQGVDRWRSTNGDGWAESEPRYTTRLPDALYRKSVFDKVGFFDESLRYGEDFDFWVRIRFQELIVRRIPAVISVYHRKPVDNVRDRRMNIEVLKRNLDALRAK